MSDDARIEADRQLLVDAEATGGLAKYAAYVKLSGPGWLQSALTLGGGSLGGSLYLGILAGVSMIWLQPFAMILGVIMLSAISYVTLSTGERPFRAINEHINPVLGWSWLAASLMANMVWSMPQYSLCFAVMEQNFFPSWFAEGGMFAGEAAAQGKWVVSISILVFCTLITWSYGSGSVGVKIYEGVLKVVVAVIVLCFFGVVIRMSMVGDGVDWAGVLSGLIPKWRHLFQPSDDLKPLLDVIADPAARQYWSDKVVSQQRDVMLAAGAAAVGINMTFLLPYNLLSSGWTKEFRGLSIFDMCTGMFVPFVVATGCIVIASATQFHAQFPEGIEVNGSELVMPTGGMQDQYDKLMTARTSDDAVAKYQFAGEPSVEEAKLAATALVKRDTGALADSLKQLFANENGEGGGFFSNIVFGVGVVGMTLSSISLMMVISGFVVCEVCNVPPKGWTFRLGCMISAVGVLWPLFWAGGAKAWMTVVAGVFGSMLIPIAYVTFYFLMNQETLMGDERPKGAKRLFWNICMAFAALAATGAGVSAVYKRGGTMGLVFVVAYIALVLFVQMSRRPNTADHSAAV
ncbi:MAG: divalent metal cation transporter [Planctomycetota bacterium]